jgi:hypothetical protein
MNKHRCVLGVCPHAASTISTPPKTMNTKDLVRLGVPVGEPIQFAQEFIRNFIAHGKDGAQLEAEIFTIFANPQAFFADELRAPLARAIYRPPFTPRAELAPWRQSAPDSRPNDSNDSHSTVIAISYTRIAGGTFFEDEWPATPNSANFAAPWPRSDPNPPPPMRSLASGLSR